MEYSDYKKSRDLSWQILIENYITEMPVKVSHICKRLGIPIICYEKAEQIIKTAGLEKICSQNDGITFMRAIFYNGACSVGRQRFTIAHELGHILMHGENGCNRPIPSHDARIEQEANVFAARILAPACVLWGIGVTNEKQICQKCDISLAAARFRMQRLQVLYEREKRFLKERGKSCFLLSALEKKVYDQFSDYIKANRL